MISTHMYLFLNYRTGSLIETDFINIRPIQGGSINDRGNFNSQVYLVDYVGPGVLQNKEMLLKVYNPVLASNRFSESTRASFLQRLSNCLIMFATEVFCYKILNENGPDEVNVSSFGFDSESETNYVPQMYQYGFLKWKAPQIGFFILQEYIKPERVESKSKAIELATTSLEFIHNKDIIHEDIKESNFIFGNGRCYFIDFGLARVERFILYGNGLFNYLKENELDNLKYVISNLEI
ncbi:hypothetical protein DFJ63DRAFT_338432 [Scheffersomyces coipomensis]|uniref:uncharacterized protein n=1 Tax=Scheffersomyces coipomensis TaxID=1788519 RepID=UPI00315D87D2